MHKYYYIGPVLRFDACISSKWSASTMATTERKARSNLQYQFKKANNLAANTKITLPGELYLEESYERT